MRKIFSLLFVALLSVASLQACAKKVQVASNPSELTILVMDSTQALLDGVKVKIGKQVFTTSFDGRLVLKAGQWREGDKVSMTREGFENASLQLKGGKEPLIVILKEKPFRPGKDDTRVAYATREVGMPKSTAYPMVKMAVAGEDGMYIEEKIEIFESRDIAPRSNAAAGTLTAGEVNDFAKWSLWPKILDGKHAPFIQTWRIEPKQRYTVQVMTKDGYPVVNYPVNLTYDGNTLFQAITDNTGKAELWGNLMTDVPPTIVRVPEKTIVIDEPCEAPDGVDVMFVFDATGSMGDELEYLQAEMKDVIARAKDATGGLNIRTGAVVYRDHGDQYITRLSRLTEDIKTTQAFIDKQEASGGGDYPEAVPEALMAALNSAGWDENARARIAFLVLDAPCHEDSATIALLHDQILNAAAMGVRIVPVVCSGINESAEYLMRSIALATNGTSFFLTDDSGIGHSHLKPTTDSLKVEHLNDMLVRTIVEFSTMPECKPLEQSEELTENEQFIPNPFNVQDLEADPTIPHGEGVHYLVDVTGKLLGIFEGDVPTDQLPIGVYFIKTFYDGQWYTKKILVR